MRVLVLSKRQYTNKDLLDDKYGRIFELAKGLVNNNIEVTGLSLSYRSRNSGQFDFELGAKILPWHSVNLVTRYMPNIKRYFGLADQILRNFKPDVIWGSSDAIHIVIASKLAQKYGIKFIADLYDNYESFSATKIPGLTPLFRASLKNASAITCASESIANLYRPYHTAVKVIENAVDTDIFKKLNRQKCRQILDIAEGVPTIGTAGSLSSDRDIEMLFSVFEEQVTKNSNLRLLLAGKLGRGVQPPQHKNVRYLGEMPYNDIPLVFNAMDVAVVCNKSSAFGNFCFPQKMYEIISCKTPIVIARTRGVESLLSAYPDSTYSPGDMTSLSRAVVRQLKKPSTADIHVKNWNEQAIAFIDVIRLLA